jgi:outer membrane receptor for ferrienterochelin and colicins
VVAGAVVSVTGVGAQAGATVVGTVRSASGPLHGATVILDGVAGGPTRTDTAGRFRLVARLAGAHQVRIRALGHAPAIRDVRLVPGRIDTLDVTLAASASVLNTVVTTATSQERYVSDSPVKVDVVTPAFLQRNVGNNLMDNVSFLPGLAQQVDCGVCFTNNIRINGMEGPYTAVLIDGTPLVSALATVYGLNSIDPSLIEQIEIVKGPGSTLYGSEAMGGVINIVTKDARLAPRLSVNAFGTSNGEGSVAIGAASSVGNARSLLSISGAHNDRFVDRNADGFADLPLVSRLSVLNKWSVGTAARQPLSLLARYYYEDRFGGVRDWTRADRGSSVVYGESIRTHRAEVLGTYRVDPAVAPLRFDLSANWHDQDSFYGRSPFMATQSIAFAQGVWSPVAGAHALQVGAAVRYQSYTDSTAAQRTREARLIPGVFAQDELPLGSRATLLAGLRLDHHERHGVIPSPRLALKVSPDPHTTVRLNAATGFRVVSLFTEDHAALTGARTVRIAERLDPERSASVTLGVNRVHDVQGIEDALTLDLDLFLTRFSNRIVGDFDTDPSSIIYANLDGYAVTRGASVAAGYATLRKPFFANLGLTWQDVFVREQGVRRSLPFAPRMQGVFSIGYRVDRAGMTLDWTGRVQGPTALPHFAGLPSESQWLTEQHLQVTKRLGRGPELYLAVKNLFDYVQRDAIIDPGNPFGDAFATERVYGPLQGRRFLFGMRYVAGR